MKGAKPKGDAVRRKAKPSDAIAAAQNETAVVLDARAGALKPPHVEENPVLSKYWDWLCPPVNHYDTQDIPLLVELCEQYAILEQTRACIDSRGNPGGINLFEKIGVKPDDTPLFRINPALSVRNAALTQVRHLSDMLGLSPLARSRIGLMDAVKVKSAADTAKTFRDIGAAYGHAPQLGGVVPDAKN